MFTLRQQRERGERASRLLNDELFIEAISQTRSDYIEDLLQLDPIKTEQIIEIKRKLRALDDVVERLTGIEGAGKIADREIKD